MSDPKSAYLKKVDAPHFFDKMLKELTAAQPDDLIPFLSQYLEKQGQTQGGKGGVHKGISMSGLGESTVFDIPATVRAINTVTAPDSTHHEQWVKPWDRNMPRDRLHHFTIFLKPNGLDYQNGVDVGGLLSLMAGNLERHGVAVGAIRVLGGPYIDRNKIIQEHYGVIAEVSRGGEAALTPQAKEKLRGEYKQELGMDDESTRVVGGHQFLADHPEFTPLALTTLQENLGSKKLGGGQYAMRMKVQGQSVAVLNPFHPHQMVPFTSMGRCIVVLECLAPPSLPWTTIRGSICGATDPSVAEEGSMRGEILRRKTELGMGDVSTSNNTVHCSAGPLEGMVELKRFFLQDQPDFGGLAFADMLNKAGCLEKELEKLAGNCLLDMGGTEMSAFDATEESDANNACDKLVKAVKRK